MYRALSELEELTQELAQAADRGDKVSVQMSLAMRRDPLEQVARHQAALRRQYTALAPADARLLRALLEDPSPPAVSGAEALVRQAARNRALLGPYRSGGPGAQSKGCRPFFFLRQAVLIPPLRAENAPCRRTGRGH